MKQEIKFGDKVKDKITGFTGIVISKIEYDTGCIQYGVKARVKKDGTLLHVVYVDEAHVEIINKPKKEEIRKRQPLGGIMADAPKN